MILQKVKLTKLATDNGMFHMVDRVKVGKEYWLQTATARVAIFKSLKTGKFHKAIIMDDEEGKYMPVELFEFTNEFASKEFHG